MEKVSPYLCPHSGPTLQAILLQAVKNVQLNEVATTMSEM